MLLNEHRVNQNRVNQNRVDQDRAGCQVSSSKPKVKRRNKNKEKCSGQDAPRQQAHHPLRDFCLGAGERATFTPSPASGLLRSR